MFIRNACVWDCYCDVTLVCYFNNADIILGVCLQDFSSVISYSAAWIVTLELYFLWESLCPSKIFSAIRSICSRSSVGLLSYDRDLTLFRLDRRKKLDGCLEVIRSSLTENLLGCYALFFFVNEDSVYQISCTIKAWAFNRTLCEGHGYSNTAFS